LPTPISDAMWGYLAGMIDGEGSLMLGRNRGRKENPIKYTAEYTTISKNKGTTSKVTYGILREPPG